MIKTAKLFQKKRDFFVKLTLFLLIIVTAITCQREKCVIDEVYPSGKVKLLICVLNEKTDFMKFTKYYESGEIESTYESKMGVVSGMICYYYPNGRIKSEYEYKDDLRNGININYLETGEIETKCEYKDDLRDGVYLEFLKTGEIKRKCIYKNDLRNGICANYLKNGKISSMNYCIEGKTIYGKYYAYDSMGITFSENFDPIINVIKKEINTISFTANLPIPDSLTSKPSSILKYDLKPVSLKDSFILETRYEAEINHSEPFYGKLKTRQDMEQVFYGYILGFDTITNQQLVYNAFEIPILSDSTSTN